MIPPALLAKAKRIKAVASKKLVFDRASQYFAWIPRGARLGPEQEPIPDAHSLAEPDTPDREIHPASPAGTGDFRVRIAGAERARLRAILLDSAESRDEGRFRYMAELALTTDLPAEKILGFASQAIPRRNWLSEAMALLPNPSVGIEGDASAEDTEAMTIARGIALLPENRRAASHPLFTNPTKGTSHE